MQKTKGGEEYLANISKDSPARKILESEIKHKPNFDKDEVQQQLTNKRLLRKYFVPPEANWGPKARATGGKKEKKKEQPTETDEVKE